VTPALSGRAAYPLLLALGALNATGYSVIVPVAPAIADATRAGPATIGLLVASFPTGMVAGFAIAGAVVRRRRAKALRSWTGPVPPELSPARGP
jgi:crotonobetainyl-CoA:carnitine CoA-transferase CaiB-like acyl-CoA transferase